MKKEVHLIRQLGTTDCGIACLAMILQYYGCDIGINDLNSKINVGRDGLSLSSIKYLVEDIGFSFSAYYDYLNKDNLISLLPVMLITKENHYIVISKYEDNNFVVLNPESGKYKVDYNFIENNYLKNIIIIRPTNKKYKKFKKSNNIGFYINKVKLVQSIIFTFISQIIVLIPPILIKNIIDSLEKKYVFEAKKYILLMIALIVGYFIFNLLKNKTIITLQTDEYRATVNKMINKIFSIDLTFFENHLSGDLLSRFNSVGEIYEFISSLLLNLIFSIITSIFCGVLIFIESKAIFLSLVIITLAQSIFVSKFNKVARVKSQNYLADKNMLDGKITEILSNIQQIRCMRIDSLLSKKIKEDYDHLITTLKDRDIFNAVLESVSGAFSIFTTLIIYIIGGILFWKGLITLGVLVSCSALATYFTAPFVSISLILPQINILKETIIRLEELLNYKVKTNDGTKSVSEFNSIVTKNVSFSYFGTDTYDITNLNLEINKGEEIAIVGDSGSGKTTIIKLILNLFSKYEGQILLNGTDIKEIKKSDVDRLFSIVTQVPLAISGSIKNNIDMTHSASDQEIYKLLKIVELYEDVKKFPLKINTNIGENGQNISGGQKQRVAIARALSTKPQVLILDEATSNLDSRTEKKIFDNLRKLSITLIIITHRIEAIKDCDRIYYLKDGVIVEEGKHQELINNKQFYYFDLQNK